MSEAEVETTEVRPDRQIGSYRLVRPLGSGGMSSVFQAVHTETGVEVAVKVLPRSLAKNPTTLQRFLREAKSVEALQHPNIVAIYDRGVDQGRHYLVLEYVHGGDLHDWVRANGQMPIADAVKVIREVAEGLKYAAAEGVIHRDIKPANLLLTDSGHVKVTDLGLALQSVDEDERVTREGTTVGTVDYMSPEQARDSRATSVRSDIYSLGCTFFFLVTGSPPYPGGDVAEKLAKHCTSPPVDPRSLRPDIPDPLARLILKMTAKKAENRFAGYDELLDALSAADGSAPISAAIEAPLDALIDDDEEEDDDDAVLLTLAEPTASSTSKKPKKPPAPPRDEVSMADLAELDDAPKARTKKPPKVAEDAVPQVPIRRGEGLPDHGQTSLFDEENDPDYALPGAMPAAFPSGSSRKMSAAERSWIMAFVLGGLGLIVLVIAVDQLIKASKSPEFVPVVSSADDPVAPIEPVRPNLTPVEPVKAALKTASSVVKTPDKTKVESAPLETPKTSFVEPADPVPEVITESQFGPGIEAKFRPEWASAEIPARLPGKLITVRRIPDGQDADQKSSIRAALDVVGGGTIELADDGPFFENDLHFGEARLIRARAGFRPILSIKRPKIEADGAFLDLGERALTLDGIDIIVDVSDLPRSQPALFLCGGGSLNLQNCTVTVVNRSGYPFAIVATKASDKSSHFRIERCTIRGAYTALADLSAAPADVVVTRSLVFNGQGVGFSVVGSAMASRGLFLSRSIFATRGPCIEMSDAPGGAVPKALTLKVLGCTLAHFQTPAKTSLMTWRGNGANAGAMVSWQGDHNLLQGWSDWLSVGTSHAVRVPDTAGARAVWPGTDLKTTEEPAAWPAPQAADRVTMEDLRVLAKSRLDVLSRAATPTPLLHQKTVEPFAKVAVPELFSVAVNSNNVTRGSGPIPGFLPKRSMEPVGLMKDGPASNRLNGINPPRDERQARGGTPATVATDSAPGVREFVVDVEAAPGKGDLGRFLAETVRPGDRLIRLRVSGSTIHDWSPFRMPDGVSLEIIVTPNQSGQVPSWMAIRGVSAEALISLRNGSLKLEGVQIERDGARILKHLVRVERGHLVLINSRLRGTGKAEPDGGKLIAFVAAGTLPLEPAVENTRTALAVPATPSFGPAPIPKNSPKSLTKPRVLDPFPFSTHINRPTFLASDCVLMSGGNVVEASIGRGLLALFNSVIVSGQNAFVLTPSHVARSRFDSDLILSRCSLSAEHAFVKLGPWPGSDPGPDRPWLVSTQNSAFFGTFEKPEIRSVLLQAEPGSLAHGTVFWQASGDAFEVPVFAAAGETPPGPGGNPAARRHDVNQNWAALWGDVHFHNVIGPKGPSGTPSTRLLARLRPGEIDPRDLIIDMNFPPGRKHHEIGVDFATLGIIPTSRGVPSR